MAVWYRTGTLSVTNGSTTVTGAGTGWTTTVRAGDFLFIGTNQPVEVATVVSNTSLTLAVAWGGSTGSGLSYAIAAGPQWGDVTRLSLQIAELIASQVEILSGTGAPSGGLGSDGSVYFRQDVPEYYAKAAGSWGSPISLVGPTGSTGPTGPTGSTGPANSLAIGSVTTGAAGSSASATITGTAPSQTLNLIIPRGNTGATGTQGAQGDSGTLSVGTVTTGAAGSSASVTNSGTSTAAVLNFTIPRGDTGAAGTNGADGVSLTPQGTYGSGTTYSAGDVVLDQNSSWVYINVTPGSGNAPPTLPTESNTYWQLLARAGVDGTGSGTVTSVNSVAPVAGGNVTLHGEDVPITETFTNFTPASANVLGIAQGIDTALGAAGSPSLPQGRLTLTTGQPVLNSNVTAATVVYYTPYAGQRCPIYNGSVFVMLDLGGELSQATTDATKSPAAAVANKNYDIFVWNDGGTYRATRGPAWSSDTSRGTGAGTSELERVKGILVNKQAITNGPAAQRGTYVGTIRTNGSAQIDMQFVDVDAASNAASIGVWNMYNRVRTRARLIHNGGSTHTYSTSTWRQYGGLANVKVSFVSGLAHDAIDAGMGVGIYNTATGDHHVCLNIDSTSTSYLPFVRGLTNSKLVGTAISNIFPPQLGYHSITINEIANVAGQAATVYQSLFSLAAVLRA